MVKHGSGDSELPEEISRMSLCGNLTADDIGVLARHLTVSRHTAGSVLYTEGDSGPNDLLIILDGKVEINSPNRFNEESSQLHIQLATGDVAGIMGFVGNQPHVGTARALSDCRLARLPREQFNHICDGHPRIAICLLQFLVQALDRFGTRLLDQYKASLAFMYGAVKK